MEEHQNTEQFASSNEGYTQPSALAIRLDTNPIIQRLEMYLRGYVERIIINENGEPVLRKEQTGEKKANNKGIQSIMSWVTSLLNAQIVQGFIKDHEALGDYMTEISNDFTDYIHLNMNKFDIDLYEVNGIINLVMTPLYAFLSRLVQNKERESYAATIRTTESSNTTAKGGMKIPGFGG